MFGPNGDEPDEPYLTLNSWDFPVQYFVGRNGSGKSRTARAVFRAVDGRFLSTDRLVGLMNFNNYGWGSDPIDYKGVPLGDQERQQISQMTKQSGVATEELYALREQPEVWLRVAAFIRRALGRSIELRESAGYLDPYVRLGDTEYSLLRDEGHGLRELVVLLTATYRSDSRLLIVDEPELHLHPSMSRLWLSELNRECERTGRRAIIVTHEPSFVRPLVAKDLGAIWMFSAGERPRRVSDSVLPVQETRVTASLAQNPLLISQIAFSPRPVLVEGATDVAAMSTCLSRLMPAEVVAQTDIVDCGGSGGVALWLEICTKLGLDVRAIADLDALFSPDVQRVIDSLPGLRAQYVAAFATEPGLTSKVVQPLVQAADQAGIAADPAHRSEWLAGGFDPTSAVAIRKSRILEVLKEHGLWLHPQGALEGVLGLTSKGVIEARAAAMDKCALDDAAEWAAYKLDLRGDIELLLGVAVERVAHAIMEAQRGDPTVLFTSPVGGSAKSDSRLVSVVPVGKGVHRIVVIAPDAFAGHWVEFSRETPSTELLLSPPTDAE